eukprot:5458599-Pyramimonas_sp.AAC.1
MFAESSVRADPAATAARRAIYFRPDWGPRLSAAAIRSMVRNVGETCPAPQAWATAACSG